MEKINQIFIKNLERLLEGRRWRIPDLAKATGLSASGLYGVASGKSWPGPDNLDRIAAALRVSVAQLLADPDAATPPDISPDQIELLRLTTGLNKAEMSILFDDLGFIHKRRARLSLVKKEDDDELS